MSGEDSFIARWSRLKQQAADESRKPHTKAERDARLPLSGADAGPAAEAKAPAGSPPARPEEPAPPFDVASLPPIESIVAGTDIRAFLQKGVPAVLTRAALRRAWSADPAIRDFIEVAENQWDFTDPTAIPGFGPLQATDNLRQLVGQALGKLPEAPPDAPDVPTASASSESPDVAASANAAAPDVPPSAAHTQRIEPQTEAPAMHTPTASLPEMPDNPATGGVAAPQHPTAGQEADNAPRRRGHGRAIPR